MTVVDILEALESIGSRLEKEAILKRNIDNELLRKTFVAAQDPYTVYYVNKFKMPKPGCELKDDVAIADFLNVVLPALASRHVTGNEAKTWVETAFAKMDERQQKWCQRVILKNLRCGVQESTVNKAWPGTLKSFAVSLAETLKTSHDPKVGTIIHDTITYPVFVEPKLDGLRCVAVKNQGTVTFYTRNGTVLETLPRVKAALERAPYDNVVIDGEAMGNDWNESASVLMSKKSKKDDANITFYAFDAVPLSDWIVQTNVVSYRDRQLLLASVLQDLGEGPVKKVPSQLVIDEATLRTAFAKSMDEGHEGIMLKDPNAPYRFKRSDAVLKMKPVVTYEGVIVGHYEGKRGTKREGLFGGFNVMLPNRTITNVGGGFSDALKAQIQLEGAEVYHGKIVELEGQPDPLTKDGLTKDGKVRFPVFIRFRSESDVDASVLALLMP